MLKCKIINPKWFIIILMLFLSIIIFNNNIEKTFCEKEYQIAECPNNLYLSSYYITAENNASAISAVENILLNNNFNLDDYEIIVENNIIKIIEKEKQETIEKEKAETEKQEIEEIKKAETEETTTIKNNNLEIKNENVEFNDNNNIEKDRAIKATSGQADFIIYRAPDGLEGEEGKIYMNNGYSYFRYYQLEKIIKDKSLNPKNYDIEIRKETYNSSAVIDANNFTQLVEIDDYIKIYITKNENAIVEEIKKFEGGGGSGTTEINTKELEKINMCICMLLAIMFIYNFANSMFKR